MGNHPAPGPSWHTSARGTQGDTHPTTTLKPIALSSCHLFFVLGGASSDLPESTETDRHFSIYSTSVQDV